MAMNTNENQRKLQEDVMAQHSYAENAPWNYKQHGKLYDIPLQFQHICQFDNAKVSGGWNNI